MVLEDTYCEYKSVSYCPCLGGVLRAAHLTVHLYGHGVGGVDDVHSAMINTTPIDFLTVPRQDTNIVGIKRRSSSNENGERQSWQAAHLRERNRERGNEREKMRCKSQYILMTVWIQRTEKCCLARLNYTTASELKIDMPFTPPLNQHTPAQPFGSSCFRVLDTRMQAQNSCIQVAPRFHTGTCFFVVLH